MRVNLHIDVPEELEPLVPRLLRGSATRIPMPDESVQCAVTSPPYWGLRKYPGAQDSVWEGDAWRGPYGQELVADLYVQHTVQILRELRRVLRKDGVLFWNIADSYDKKSLALIPQRIAVAAQQDGWLVRSDIIWNKPNPMPSSVKDRPTNAYEHVLVLTKSAKYFWDIDALREPHKEISLKRIEKGLRHRHPVGAGVGIPPVNTEKMGTRFCHPKGRNTRDVWTLPTSSYKGAHFAVFPEELPRKCILAATRFGDVVLDPFGGSGTTGKVAMTLARRSVLLDKNYGGENGFHTLADGRFRKWIAEWCIREEGNADEIAAKWEKRGWLETIGHGPDSSVQEFVSQVVGL
jgi:DNA modification methylase